MGNMVYYDQLRKVPNTAKKQIEAGRLKGFTNINPMWRIKVLTSTFGPVGIGWYYEITKQWAESGANGEAVAFCNINLYIKIDGEWSRPIQGTGGSALIAAERNGKHTSDECYKMALTDALSVACKSLGVGADVYFQSDINKYDYRMEYMPQKTAAKPEESEIPKMKKCKRCGEGVAPASAKKWEKYCGKVYCSKECYEADMVKQDAAANR